jgi:glycosyltransferase involved in cell wall biosynthesis
MLDLTGRSVRSFDVPRPGTRVGATSGATSGTVLLVGDIAGVAATQSAVLTAHSTWTPIAAGVAGRRRSSKMAQIADLPLRAVATRRTVRDAVHQWHPDVVHLHWARYAPFVDTAGCPLVVHLHGSDVRGRGRSLSGRFVHRALRRADAVLASTPDLIADVPEARYVPNPIDLEVFTPDGEFDPSPPTDVPTVLLFARLDPVKGAAALVEIGAELRRRRSGIRVIGVAGGRLDAEATAVGVDLASPRGPQAVAALIRSAQVVVGQQHLGALGLSELEAMACARPIVAPVRGDLYGDDLPVVRASGPTAVVEACLGLIDDEDRRHATGAAGRVYVVDRHSPALVAAELAAVYSEAAG